MLQTILQQSGIVWIEDPSNGNMQFERVRIRQSLPTLNALGISNAAMASSARRLLTARMALQQITAQWCAVHLKVFPEGYVQINWAEALQQPDELRLRILRAAIALVRRTAPPPRLMDVERLILQPRLASRLPAADKQAENPSRVTAGGCVLTIQGGRVSVFREYGRITEPVLPLEPGTKHIWDGRFELVLSSKAVGQFQAAALGPSGWLAVQRSKNYAADLPPRLAAITMPALWHGKTLAAAPSLGFFHPDCTALRDQFYVTLLPAAGAETVLAGTL
jgi:tRNA(Ile)-lysidine synthase